MNKNETLNIVCPLQDWGIFFAIGAARSLEKNGFSVRLLPKSIAQENILATGIGIDACDDSSMDGGMLFMSPDPIAEMDARKRGIEVYGCVADEADERWVAVSGCWNGHGDESIIKLYSDIFGQDMNMRVFEQIKGTKPYAGVAVKSDPVRMLIKSAFFIENSRLWHVPIRQNVSKRIQESCTCATLVTDDAFCALASYAHGNSVILLRKPCDGLPKMHEGLRFTEQDIAEHSH